MTINEAIEILEEMLKPSNPYWIQDYVDAMLLGIEALKYIIYQDNCPGINTRLLLPGETR